MEIDRRETGGISLPKRKEQHLMEKTTMSVQELSAQMGISLPKAYELVKIPGFPTIRIGARILIPIEAYKEWLVRTSINH
jgi:excisionase family DNA binding protein